MPDSRKLNFTKAALQALRKPLPGKRATYYDTQTRGLHLIITDKGTKTFYVRRMLNGVSRISISGPAWSSNGSRKWVPELSVRR